MWLELLRQAVSASSQGRVAAELGISRTAISLVLADKYPAKTDHIEFKVMTKYAQVQCPFLGQEIAFAACVDYYSREAPTSSPFAMRHWRACQACPNRKDKP